MSLRGVKIEFKGPRHKHNELIQMRSDIGGELLKITQLIADGENMAANQYVESFTVYLAFVSNLGEKVDRISLWKEFDKSEQELIWKVDS